MLERRLQRLQSHIVIESPIAIVYHHQHIQIGLVVPRPSRARAVEDNAKHAVGEARPQAVKILAERRPLLWLELSQFFNFHDTRSV